VNFGIDEIIPQRPAYKNEYTSQHRYKAEPQQDHFRECPKLHRSPNTFFWTRLGLLGSQSPSLVSLLGDGELDTLTLGQGDPRLGSFTDDENVGKTEGRVRNEVKGGRAEGLTEWQRFGPRHLEREQCRNHRGVSPAKQSHPIDPCFVHR
jgi:hypothetical protein